MVALVTNVRVDLLQVRRRRHIGIEQHKGIGAAWATWGPVLEIHAIRTHAREG
ncbi:hypothetical protein D1872_346690 [compost metagenome]